MFEQLNLRTRRIVESLCAGNEAQIAGIEIGPLKDGERMVLATIASEMRRLSSLGGRDLIQAYREASQRIPPEALSQDTKTPEIAMSKRAGGPYTLGEVLCCSFRGVAPAGRVWRHDFRGRSHLLHGPNGCGKSSLLGAISWCLTGRLYRDDQPPDKPNPVKVYSGDGSKLKAAERPDALSLLDRDGATTKEDEEYWVRVQLLGRNGESTWIERHSVRGLRESDDAQTWVHITSLDEAGLDELDTELHFLMPARLGHLRFGKDATVIRVLSQLVGLDDLLLIAEIAHRLATELRRAATKLEKEQLRPQTAKTQEHVAELKEKASDGDNKMARYGEVTSAARNLERVREFGTAGAKAITEGNAKLAKDLGLVPPQEDTPDANAFERKIKDLHGQVHSALDELARPLSEVFKSSMGFVSPTDTELDALAQKLSVFENTAKHKVSTRLMWAREERKDEKADLMLLAASHFSPTSPDCPVCTQDLTPVPHIRQCPTISE